MSMIFRRKSHSVNEIPNSELIVKGKVHVDNFFKFLLNIKETSEFSELPSYYFLIYQFKDIVEGIGKKLNETNDDEKLDILKKMRQFISDPNIPNETIKKARVGKIFFQIYQVCLGAQKPELSQLAGLLAVSAYYRIKDSQPIQNVNFKTFKIEKEKKIIEMGVFFNFIKNQESEQLEHYAQMFAHDIFNIQLFLFKNLKACEFFCKPEKIVTSTNFNTAITIFCNSISHYLKCLMLSFESLNQRVLFLSFLHQVGMSLWEKFDYQSLGIIQGVIVSDPFDFLKKTWLIFTEKYKTHYDAIVKATELLNGRGNFPLIRPVIEERLRTNAFFIPYALVYKKDLAARKEHNDLVKAQEIDYEELREYVRVIHQLKKSIKDAVVKPLKTNLIDIISFSDLSNGGEIVGEEFSKKDEQAKDDMITKAQLLNSQDQI